MLNIYDTHPDVPKFPPALSNTCLTSEAVLFLLSVFAFTITATPHGPYPSYVISSYTAVLPSPDAFLIALFIVSFGIFAALHFAITSFSFEFPAGSGPPAFTAINNSLPNFVNTFPLAASAFPFLACILCHLLCPDISNSSYL